MDATPSRPGRKKRRLPCEWAQNKRKVLRNMGAEYLGVSGKAVQARKIGPDCKCGMECFERIDEQNRQLVFEKFWPLADYNVTCLARWSPESRRYVTTSGKEWQVNRDGPGHGSIMLLLPGTE